jgi:hypothetical protein
MENPPEQDPKDQEEASKQKQYEAEKQRITFRRLALGVDTGSAENQPDNWALALSGGGIRSATFCLGVLQAMAHAGLPTGKGEPATQHNLLERFDYLSTVSGGGYIGSFFSSLFIPGRLRKTSNINASTQVQAQEAAANALAVLRYEPPGRISTGTDYDNQPLGRGPGAWLRENGRYLTPTGSGDLLYAVAMAWRSWLSLHFVMGMPILLCMALLTLLKLTVVNNLFVLPAAAAALLSLPLALAYWLVIPKKNLDEPASLQNEATKLTGSFLVGLLICAALVFYANPSSPVAILFSALLLMAFLAISYAYLLIGKLNNEANTPADGQATAKSIRNYRVVVTRQLSQSMTIVIGLFFLATLGTLAQELYKVLQESAPLVSAGVLPVLIWLVRQMALLKDEKELPAWTHNLPLGVLAMTAGGVVLSAVVLTWALLVYWIAAAGTCNPLTSGYCWRLLITALLAAAVILINSKFIGFLNVSSLQGFYSSRLTRAYLGASNRERFGGTTEQRKKRMSVAEPLAGDDISVEDYYGCRSAGPLHLINVTMNLTVDPAEQLVQRDRKGKPLCIAPGWQPIDGATATPVSYILDGVPYEREQDEKTTTELTLPLSIGQWVGVSGAAFTTGLGRTTSLGLSLALGLANVRLGIWWPSRFKNRGDSQWSSQDPWLVKQLPTQAYLFYEFCAHFHGHRRDYQYLSDGGHFENTATYELLRPERNIELIVMCDCGCDPKYQFDDLANLVRLARIDHALDIVVDEQVCNVNGLKGIFGRMADFKKPLADAPDLCALLLNVYRCVQDTSTDTEQRTPISRILLLKPRLVNSLAPDVVNYAQSNPTFPNQTTIDQFFDEAQFESYRQLGLSIGRLVFNARTDGVQPKHPLWDYLQSARHPHQQQAETDGQGTFS